MRKTIHLIKLVVTGQGKKPAIIDFQPGLNVISGPSDSGKTLIFECINYALGSGTLPHAPLRTWGYTTVFLSIKSSEGIFTLKRSLESLEISIIAGDYQLGVLSILKAVSADAKAKENISDFLLDLVEMKNKRLKKNERNETVKLTFNILKKTLLVDELRIQERISPILTGIPTSLTTEKALFRFLITGVDYSDITSTPKKEIVTSNANAKIEVLKQLIENTSITLDKNESEIEIAEQIKKIELSINSEIAKISADQEEISSLQHIRKTSWDLSITADSKREHLQEIFNRFKLLAKYYDNDLDRLDAIIETGVILSYTDNFVCPLCGSEAKHHRPECVISNQEIDIVKIASEQEKIKIDSLKADLAKTTNELETEMINLHRIQKENEKEYESVDKQITERLQPKMARSMSLLTSLYNLKKDAEIKLKTFSQISLMKELKHVAEMELQPVKRVQKHTDGVRTTEVSGLLDQVYENLLHWGYPEVQKIGFSETVQDYTIGTKNRSDQGKGYRAITHAAFIISLMEYCITKELSHPGFVILDSPLVTFKEAEKENDINELISEDMKDMFYNDLAGKSPEMQIIIIENDDPSAETANKINYIHFTKNSNKGRYGFIEEFQE